MSQIIASPQELVQFARYLRDLARTLKERKTSLNHEFAEVGEVWRDEKYQQFQRIFEETSREIDVFLKEAERYSEYLNRKAKPLQAYLDRRYS